MIWELMKRETAWREVYGYIGVVTAIAIFLPEHASAVFIFVVGFAWIRSLPAERATLFQAGLPIAASDLFLARVLAFLALVWLPATAGAAVLLVRNGGNAGGMLIAAAGLSIFVLAPLSHRVGQLAGSHWAPAISMTLLSAAAWPATHYLPRNVLATLCGVLCVVLFAMTWKRLPMSFEVVGAEPSTALLRLTAAESATSPRVESRSQLLHWLPILRGAFPPMAFMFLPIIVMQNVGGQWSYAASQALFPMLMALPRLTWARGLPVPRSTLFALLVAPWLLALALNLAAGGLLFPSRVPIHYDYVADKLGSLRPPLEFWRIAPEGIAPVIESPWHETWRPPVQTVAGIAIYNPYSMGALNSRQFLEWQYRRATVAIYGREIAFNDYHPIVDTLRPLEQQARFVVLNIAACLCWLMLLVNAVFFTMHWRVGILLPRAAHFAGFVVLLPMLGPFFLEVLVKHPGNSLGTALMNAALLRLLAVLPGGIAPVLLVAIVPLSILWWTALRLFAGVEVQAADPTVRA